MESFFINNYSINNFIQFALTGLPVAFSDKRSRSVMLPPFHFLTGVIIEQLMSCGAFFSPDMTLLLNSVSS